MPHKSYRRARTDYPKGIIGIYDHGKETPYFERYTVVYTPDTYTPEGGRPEEWFSYAYISEDGEGSHGECRGWERPRATWGGNKGAGKTIAYDALPEDVKAFVQRDLMPICQDCFQPVPEIIGCPDGAEVCAACFDQHDGIVPDACEFCGESGHDASEHEGEDNALAEYNAAHADFTGYN